MTRARNRIVLVAALVSFLLLGAFAYALGKADHDAREDAKSRFADRARISASLVRGTITSFLPQLTDDATRSFDGAAITHQDFLKADYTSSADQGDGSSAIVLDAASGRVLGSIGASEMPNGTRLSPVPQHVRSAFDGEPSVSDVIFDRFEGEEIPSVELAVPFDSDYGERVVVSRFPLELLSAFIGGPLSDVPQAGDGRVNIIDANGVVVVANDETDPASPADDSLVDSASVRSPSEMDVAGEKSLVVAEELPSTTWTLVAAAPTGEVYGEANLLGTPLPWVIFLALMMAAVGVIVLLRKVVNDSERIDRANVSLERRNQEVERATKAKSEFLANMSHELRTPLNGIIGFSELMHDGKLGPITDDQREYLGDVLSSAEHLRELIESLLDLSKIEAGKMEFHPQPVDPREMASQVVGALSSLAARKQIEVTVEPSPDLGEVEVDPGKLRQVFYNYLSNAIKYTEDGGRVKVVTEPVDALSFRIAVEDTGIGIEEQDIPRLFSEFEQLDAGASKGSQGTGLGLALTRRIVEAQGGKVGVESKFGVGSCFEAILPRRAVAVTEDDTRTGEPVGAGHV